MKTVKKLLCTLLALTLVFCSLGSVMTVSALSENEENCKKAFSSITVTFADGEKQKVPMKSYPDGCTAWTTGKKLKIKAKMKKGWKLKKMNYYNGKTKKTKKLKNGGTVKLNKNKKSHVTIKATKGGTSATYTIFVYKA